MQNDRTRTRNYTHDDDVISVWLIKKSIEQLPSVVYECPYCGTVISHKPFDGKCAWCGCKIEDKPQKAESEDKTE